MRIQEIAVDGFGLLRDTRLEPSPRLTLVLGQNEAGKCTLLAVVRAIFFGFETNQYRALAGGRRGGWLDVAMADARRFRIERYGDQGGAGRLRVLDGDGVDLGPGRLPQLLEGVEKGVFRNIFAFGLAELAEFSRLTDSEVAARIYGAGLGLGGVSGLDVENGIRVARDGLFRPGGHNPPINVLLRQVDEVDTDLRRLDLPRDYGEAGARLQVLEARLAVLAREIDDLAAERRRGQRLLDAWPTWLELCDARAGRATIGAVRDFPVDALQRYASSTADVRNAEEALKRVALRCRKAEEALAALVVDDPVLEQRAALKRTLAAAADDKGRGTEIAGLTNDRERAQAELDESIVRLGRGWTPDRIANFDDSIAVQTEIAGRFRSLLEKADSRVETVRSDLKANETALAETQRELADVDERLGEITEAQAGRGPVEERDAGLRALVDLVARVDAVRASAPPTPEPGEEPDLPLAERARSARALSGVLERERALESMLSTLATASATAPRPILRALAIAAFGTAGGIGIIAFGGPLPVAAGLIFLAVVATVFLAVGPGSAPAPSSTATVGALRAELVQAQAVRQEHVAALHLRHDAGPEDVASFMEELDQERSEIDRASAQREQAERVAREAEALEIRIAAASAAISLSAPPGEHEIAVFRQALAADRELDAKRLGLLQQRTTLENRLVALERRKRELDTSLIDVGRDLESARTEWGAWLSERELDAALDRETAARVIGEVTAAKRPLATIRSLTDRITILEAQHVAFVASLAEIGDLLPGRGRDAGELLAGLADVERRLTTALEQDRRRTTLRDELASRLQDEEEARGARGRALAANDALLAEFDAPDGATLAAEFERTEHARVLDERLATSLKALTALSGPGDALRALEQALGEVGDIETVRGGFDDLTTRLDALGEERTAVHEEVGALRDRRAEMERDVAATESRQLRSDLQARLQAAAERWAVFAVATEMVARARQAYEQAHRPAVVETAERYFRDWTDSRYRRIVAPLGKQIESVEHRDGTLVPLTGLSRGTAEQLYLALRLGLVERFAEGAEPLPIVMDDILVNFDEERAASAARSIEELSSRHQVLYFTCHPTTPLRPDLRVDLPPLRGMTGARPASAT
jgi:uncharacterized protein YhaN